MTQVIEKQAFSPLSLWQQPAPAAAPAPAVELKFLESPGPVDLCEEEAEVIAGSILARVDRDGYCLLCLRNCAGLVVCIAADRARAPVGYPIFTPDEVQHYENMPCGAFRLACLIKMHGGELVHG